MPAAGRDRSFIRAVALFLGVLLLTATQMGGCFGTGGSSGSTPAGAPAPGPAGPGPFVVSSTVPADNATGISISASITVTFNHEVNAATITTATFTVDSAMSGAVAGVVTYNMVAKTATFNPTADLDPTDLHTVMLTAGIISGETGESLTALTFTFTTGVTVDTTPPTFAGAASAVDDNAQTITITWAAATDNVDPSASIVYKIYWSSVSGGQNFSSPIATTAPGALSFSDTFLASSTTYFYVVRAQDTSGNEETNLVEVSATTPAPRSWSADVWTPLFNGTCTAAGCHGAAPSGGLSLTPIATAYAELVGVLSSSDGGCSTTLDRVKASDSASSLLFLKLDGTTGCFLSQMPLPGPFFSATDLDTVRDWIDEGALDN